MNSDRQRRDSREEPGYGSYYRHDYTPVYEEIPPTPVWRIVADVLLILVSLAGLVLLGYLMLPQLTGTPWKSLPSYAFVNGEALAYDKQACAELKQYGAYLDRDTIFPGVFAEGLHLGDLTLEKARETLVGDGLEVENPYSVTVIIGDHTWQVNGENVPAVRTLGNVLEKAWSYGRTLDPTSDLTPYEQRRNAVLSLREKGVNLTLGTEYDAQALKKVVREIAAYVDREPVDSQIASFDFKTRTFTFTESSPGVTVNQEELYASLCAALDRYEQNQLVTQTPQVVEPTVSKEELSAHFVLIAAYTTSTTKDSNRNNNIDLACQAVNGTALMPGETFSFNTATGERTTAKGYKEAGAIAKGQSVEEVGGGVCQVSSTLFNAVARANLEIVSRTPHAWPSTYVNKGEDATVDWPSLDFKFRNNTSSPVFVIMYYKDRKVSAEIWGMTLGEGVTIDLESKIVKTLPAPTEIKYEYNASLAWGEQKTTVKARTGYVVETYKVWYQDGKETKRELMHTSTYKAYQQVVEYNGTLE